MYNTELFTIAIIQIRASGPLDCLASRFSQFVVALLATGFPAFQFRHGHNLNHKAGPPSEVLSSLPVSIFRVVLLPREPGLFPRFIHVRDEVVAETTVDAAGLLGVG